MNRRSDSAPNRVKRRLRHGTLLVAVAASLGTVAALAPPAAAAAPGISRTAASVDRASLANTPPGIPDRLATSPPTECAGGFIGNTSTTLMARVEDAESPSLTAQFQVFDADGTGPVAERSVTATAGGIAAASSIDLPSGDYRWRVRATDPAGAASAWTGYCVFSVDRVRPDQPPTVSSEEFPDGDAGWPAETGAARTPGTFTFGANGVDDVVEYVWYSTFDAQRRKVSASPGGTAEVTATPLTGGPHMMYVHSLDRSGNRSDTTTYRFYARGITAPDAPGDLNGDGAKDIWSLDDRGELLTYAGRGDGTFAPAAGAGLTAPGAGTTYRTDWDDDGYVDLVTLEYNPNARQKQLWVHSNSGLGRIDGTRGRQLLTVDCPVPDEDYGCVGEPGWTGDDHWGDAEQVIAPGDLNGDGRSDLLVREGGRLWIYHGMYGMRLDVPVAVGGSDWDDFTVLAPGDLDGDGSADLWLRSNATGDLYSVRGGSGTDGGADPAGWGDPANRVLIGTGFTVAARPALDTVGDLDGDGVADLHGRTQDGTLTLWPGRVAADGGFGFGQGRAIG
ncbi:FG-GAP repeat domain-containing protein [Streptomyces sp. NPDC021019]|uniref:FG-GAP repeat domain-containing protein n=1 Tax=Streptomyces sp. NPDC021019 TaxID=3365108 RepID=UPI0037B9CDED